jgi:hypothetical protein
LPVAEAEDVRDSTATDDVENSEVLGQADRLVEGQHGGGDHDREAVGPGRHRRREDQGRRKVAVIGGMVLREHGDDRATILGPRGHLDGGVVQVLDRRTERRCSHVEAKGEHPASAPAWRAGAR